MSSGKLRRLRRDKSRSSATPKDSGADVVEEEGGKRGEALKLLREKSNRAQKMRLDSPVNSASAANWRARLRAARGFKTEENTETESSNVRKVLLRINTAKYLSRDATPGGTSLDEVNTKDGHGEEQSANSTENHNKSDESDGAMKTRPSIFSKAKEQLRNSPSPTQTPSGRLLLGLQKKKKVLQRLSISSRLKEIRNGWEKR